MRSSTLESAEKLSLVEKAPPERRNAAEKLGKLLGAAVKTQVQLRHEPKNIRRQCWDCWERRKLQTPEISAIQKTPRYKCGGGEHAHRQKRNQECAADR